MDLLGCYLYKMKLWYIFVYVELCTGIYVMIFKRCKVTLNGEQHVFFTDEYGLPITSDLTVNWASIYINKEKVQQRFVQKRQQQLTSFFVLSTLLEMTLISLIE